MSIAVLDRAFVILEVLARSRRALTLAELAEEGRLPKPTVHRILKSLRDLGYVEQEDRGGAYELSGRLVSLREYGRDQAVREKARPVMERLHAAFDETVNLGLLEGIFVRYVEVIETTQPLRWIVKPGARDSFRSLNRSSSQNKGEHHEYAKDTDTNADNRLFARRRQSQLSRPGEETRAC